ncbi:hypothetical protein [Acanthopleuribacter pedis]|uniref:Leucine-rich repeat domain-containing protein n=1 Tax=Acanthopleuribacter pedis TaxID=442870 RepID=A0A8J7Q7J7_9BACT|nr:hypothetical protein [Acanthopleuribacter pedis]MBO1318274.1 hypothetical protein [Acanthopleuribacter pedis]
MSHNFAARHHHAWWYAVVYVLLPFLGYGFFQGLPLTAQEPEYRVVTIGTLGNEPTGIHAFNEQIALTPLPYFVTNDPQEAQPVAVDTSPDGATIAVVTQDQHRFLLLDAGTLTRQRRLTLTGPGMDVLFHPTGTEVYALSEAPWGKPAQVLVSHLHDQQWRYLNLPAMTQPRELMITPDGTSLIVRGTRQLCFIDLTNDHMNLVDFATTSRDWGFSPDGRFLYISNYGSAHMPGSTVEKIDLASQTVITQIPVRQNPGALSFSPDGRFLAVATFDTYPTRKTGLVEYIDTETDTVLSRPYQVGSSIETLHWLPDGRLVIAHADSFGYARLRLGELSGAPYFFVDERVTVAANPTRGDLEQIVQDETGAILYFRFRDAVIAYNTRTNAPALRYPLDQITTGMALKSDGEQLFLTTVSEDDMAFNRVVAFPTGIFTGIEQHTMPYPHHTGHVGTDTETFLFAEARKRFWSVAPEALCQIDEQVTSSVLLEVYHAEGMQTIIGRDSSRLSFFESSTGQKLRDITLGRSPDTMRVTSDEQFVLVTNRLSNTVTLVDIPGQQLVAHIPVGSSPRKMATTNTHAFVLNESSRSMSIIDIHQAAVVGTLPLTYRPSQIEITPNGETALVLHSSDRQVSVVDLITMQVTQQFPVPSSVTIFRLSPRGDRLALGSTRGRELQLHSLNPGTGQWTQDKRQRYSVGPYSAFFTPEGERLYVGISFGRSGEGELRMYDGRDLTPLGVMPTVDFLKYMSFQEVSQTNGRSLPIADPVLKDHLVSLYDLDCDGEISQAEGEHITEISFPHSPDHPDRIQTLDGLDALPRLRVIDLPNQAITQWTTLPAHLQELNLAGNEITHAQSFPEGLRLLDLSRNPLVHLPEFPSTLVAAMVQHTQLSSVPAIPAALRILALDGTTEITLPSSSLEQLWWLGLSEHDLSDLPPELHLPELRYLDLVNNRFAHIPDVARFPKLIYLDLTQNPLAPSVCDQLAELADSRPVLDIAIGNVTGGKVECPAAKRSARHPHVQTLLTQIRSNGGAQ